MNLKKMRLEVWIFLLTISYRGKSIVHWLYWALVTFLVPVDLFNSKASIRTMLSINKDIVRLYNALQWALNINSIALCRFLCRRLSIGKFKLQVSFSLGSFVSDKNIWNALSISLLYLVRVDCRPTSQQIYKRTSSNLIRKGTGCDEYVEDQLNVASKNFAKYLFDDTDGKRYL